jgi:NADH-quinone oxidoreductase subunit L
MSDLYGPIQHVTVVRTLWLILAFPAGVAFAALVYAARRAVGVRRTSADDAGEREVLARLSIGAACGALLFAGYHAALLSVKPTSERYLFDHLWRMVRVGQLDASFDLVLDPLSAFAVLVVCGGALGAFVLAARSKAWTTGRALALNALVASLLLVCLADNFVVLLFAWSAAGAASCAAAGMWWGGDDDEALAAAAGRALLLGRAADVALVLGVAVLYWGLGGKWEEGDYVADLAARFATVEVGAPTKPKARADDAATGATDEPGEAEGTESGAASLPAGEAYLTLTSYSGSVVFMDDARTPLERDPGTVLRAPFVRFPLKAGTHSFRVHMGGGLQDAIVSRVGFLADQEVALAAFGPSVTFRNLRDQLGVRDGRDGLPVRDAVVGGRVAGPVTVLALALALVLVGVLGKGAVLPLYAWRGEVAGSGARALMHAAASALVSGYFLARIWFLFALTRWLEVIAAGAAVVALALLGRWALAVVSSRDGRDAAPRIASAVDVAATRVLGPLAATASTFLDEFDRRVVGGAVGAAAIGARVVAWIAAYADDAVVDGAARTASSGVLRVGGRLHRAQSGRLQAYVLAIVLGIMALAFLPYWLR